ncbi:hypothetical protein RB195_002413 [Necator americanus]|uniref:Reverse transcriptase domain-containing protein n=1 Tax=Necator americanus TaxID=51031 RepID=A0ABR1DIX5_NECAM
MRSENLKNLPPVLTNTLSGLFTRNLCECEFPKQWKTSETAVMYKKGDPHDITSYRPICLLTADASKQGFERDSDSFVDLKKAFDSLETEAVMEALDNQGVPTQYIKNAMRKLKWDDMGMKVNGRQLHYLRSADNVVLLNLQKMMFMSNGCPIHAQRNEHIRVHQLRLHVSENEHDERPYPELGRRKRAAWGAYKSIEDVVKKTRDTRLRAHLFNTTVLPVLTYASETSSLRKQEEDAVSVIERLIERVMPGVSLFAQVKDGIRSSVLRQRSKTTDAVAFAKFSKIMWTGHVVRFNGNRWTRAVSDWVPRDIKRATGRPQIQWSDFFTESFKEKFNAVRVPRGRRSHETTLERNCDK